MPLRLVSVRLLMLLIVPERVTGPSAPAWPSMRRAPVFLMGPENTDADAFELGLVTRSVRSVTLLPISPETA